MNELRVWFKGRVAEVPPEQSIAFGRANLEPGGQVGWGHPGRFIELARDDHIHRVWGDITWRQGLWWLNAIGACDPISVRLPTGVAIDLGPWRDEGRQPPESLGLSWPKFDIVLTSGASRFVLPCEWTGVTGAQPNKELRGRPTVVVGGQLIDAITQNEFNVLYVMSREYRESADPAPSSSQLATAPQPLSYARICRALGLSTQPQAAAAVRRLVEKFREAGLIPEHTRAEDQRATICQHAVQHGIIDKLLERYGTPSRAR